jgi:hypothetical protein
MGRIVDTLRRDSLWMGVLIGILCPALIFGLIELIIFIIGKNLERVAVIEIQKILLLSVISNLFILRHYLLKLKYDLTGRGILLATFLIAILFTILEFI